jgi:hypothetical protein
LSYETPVSLQYCLFAHFVAGGNWGPLINTPGDGYLFIRDAAKAALVTGDGKMGPYDDSAGWAVRSATGATASGKLKTSRHVGERDGKEFVSGISSF